jgi:hypothetical protein
LPLIEENLLAGTPPPPAVPDRYHVGDYFCVAGPGAAFNPFESRGPATTLKLTFKKSSSDITLKSIG